MSTFQALSSLSTVLLAATIAMTHQSKQTNWAVLPQEIPKPILNAKLIGPKPGHDLLHITVSIPYRDPEGMKAFVDGVSDPKSPHYRQFITPEEAGQRFGIVPSDLKLISDYLVSQGFKIQMIAINRLSILADATVAQAEKAFKTSIKEFNVVEPGSQVAAKRFSYTVAPSVPATIRPFVSHLGGLEDVVRPRIRH